MLSNAQKRSILIIIDLLFSAYIWYVNASWGNTFHICLILSTTTFLIVYTPFEIYWSFRDIWFDRWKELHSEDLITVEIDIPVEDGHLRAHLIKPIDRKIIEEINTIIIIAHGFSDTKECLQYYYYPMALQGYMILAYDARGIGGSKLTGKRSQFIKRIEDYNKILEWIKKDEFIRDMRIFSAGFSIGAITVLCGGFPKKEVEKIIAISSISKYRQNMPKLNPLIIFSYYLKGVHLFPNDDENKKLSPYMVIKDFKERVSKEDWKRFSKKVMLIHCKNDRIIKFKNFQQNKQLLELVDEDLLILKKGGHSQKKNELALVGASLKFFNS
ncbi:MAG: serine aminopeptidase domain-containing protein [Promethearchaeota archaeon]